MVALAAQVAAVVVPQVILALRQAVLAVVEYWFCSLTAQPQLF
jgi:hypothetical protein